MLKLKIYSLKFTGPNDLLHSTNDVCEVLDKDSSFNIVSDEKHGGNEQ
jgi:hypothetical protein